jgi:hypothetical protein
VVCAVIQCNLTVTCANHQRLCIVRELEASDSTLGAAHRCDLLVEDHVPNLDGVVFTRRNEPQTVTAGDERQLADDTAMPNEVVRLEPFLNVEHFDVAVCGAKREEPRLRAKRYFKHHLVQSLEVLIVHLSRS